MSDAFRDLLDRCPEELRETLARHLAGEAPNLGSAEVAGGMTLPPCPALGPGEHCDGAWHYLGDPSVHVGRDELGRPRPKVAAKRRCPEACRMAIEARIAEERERLAGALAECRGARFEDYDVTRQREGWCFACRAWPCGDEKQHEREIVHPREAAASALEVMRAFAAGRPPQRSALLLGDLGLGKTHLLLASHFTLLGAGVRSYFVNSTDLREMFTRLGSFDEEQQREAEAQRTALVRAEVIHWDDAGDVDGDQRKRGTFAEGIKYLLDRSRAVWAVSLNGDYEAARKHPDLGPKVLSRLMQNAAIVRMRGRDQRLPRTR